MGVDDFDRGELFRTDAFGDLLESGEGGGLHGPMRESMAGDWGRSSREEKAPPEIDKTVDDTWGSRENSNAAGCVAPICFDESGADRKRKIHATRPLA